MRPSMLLSRSATCLLAAVATAAAFTLAGCGAGLEAGSSINSASVFTGSVHGGPNPVSGATVRLYSTGATGYGSAGTLLGTATTGADGSFTFSGALACTTPKQVYVTASGGNPGGGTNANYLLMAALGDCSTISASSVIYINEVTTVAAAYALSNFISITGTTVSVGAPATNANSAGTCTLPAGTEVCTAAGLVHAFNNALDLASSIGTTSALPTGQAYTISPNNDQGTVPALLINSLANAIEVCVNSTGGTATTTTTPCGKLFSYTTPPNVGTTPVAPTNTLQAAMNMAKYPENNAASIYNLPSSYNTFYSGLTSAPHDLSVAIIYKGVTIGSSDYKFTYPYYLSLDINDNVYILTQGGSSTPPVIADALNSNGTTLFQTSSLNTTACAAGIPCVSAPDALGHLWTATGTATAGVVNVVQTPAGSISATTYTTSGVGFLGLAIDKYNSVFLSVPVAASAANFYSIAGTSGTLTPVAINGTNVSTTFVPAALFFDNSDNLWVADKYTASTAGATGELINTGTTATSFGTYTPQTVDSTMADGGLYGIVTNSAGTAYTNNTTKLITIPAGNASVTSTTTITDGTSNAVSARYSAIDGAGSVFLPDNNGATSTLTSYTFQYYPPSGTYAGGFAAYLPCTIAINTTICATGSAATSVDGPRNLAIDSTGSVWVASSTNGNVVEIIGTATPAWPLLSYEKPGVTP